MNEPRRFLDDADAPPDVRRLLASAELPAAPDAMRLARSRRRVLALASLPAVGGGLMLLHKLALGALLGSVVGIGVEVGRRVLESPPTPEAAPHVEPARGHARPAPHEKHVEAPAAPSATPPEATNGVTTKPAVPSASLSPVSSADADVTRELQLLEAARRAMQTDPHRALALLEEHARVAPRGTLVVEREMLTIEALARAGRMDQAKARAERFRAAHPESLYEERITRILEQQGR